MFLTLDRVFYNKCYKFTYRRRLRYAEDYLSRRQFMFTLIIARGRRKCCNHYQQMVLKDFFYDVQPRYSWIISAFKSPENVRKSQFKLHYLLNFVITFRCSSNLKWLAAKKTYYDCDVLLNKALKALMRSIVKNSKLKFTCTET